MPGGLCDINSVGGLPIRKKMVIDAMQNPQYSLIFPPVPITTVSVFPNMSHG
jgi:hypothetical protein